MKPLEEVEPYSQVDQFYFQCGMLKQFAMQEEAQKASENIDKKRIQKQKTKIAQKCVLLEFKAM